MTTDKLFEANELDNDLRELRNYIYSQEKILKEEKKYSGCRPASQDVTDFINDVEKSSTELRIKKAKVKLETMQKRFDKL